MVTMKCCPLWAGANLDLAEQAPDPGSGGGASGCGQAGMCDVDHASGLGHESESPPRRHRPTNERLLRSTMINNARRAPIAPAVEETVTSTDGRDQGQHVRDRRK